MWGVGKLKSDKCTWQLVIIREYNDGNTAEEIWSTQCGATIGVDGSREVVAPYEFAVLGFHSPDFTYCPYCGSPIELVGMEDDDAGEED